MRSEPRLPTLALGGLVAVLLVMTLIWFLENFERHRVEVDSGYSAAARRNPFLAAEHFLLRLGMPVESRPGRDLLRDLPAPQDTLVVNGLATLNEGRREALHHWLEQGGRLIVAAMHFREDLDGAHPDDFLARYGARLRDLGAEAAAGPAGGQVLAPVDVEGHPHTLQVGFLARYYLEDRSEQARAAVVAGDQVRLLQYAVGRGLLTVTSDNAFLTNPDIGHHDHALFLALLADGGGGTVWLLYDSAMPWLGALLWQQAPTAVTSVMCLLGIFAWYLGGRLGPLLPGPSRARRDLMAHLQASVEFLWRQGQGGALNAVTRERIEQAWLRRHPSLRELESAERAAEIAGRTGLAPGEVERALYPAPPGTGAIVADTTLLQVLWLALSSQAGSTHALYESSRGSRAMGVGSRYLYRSQS